MEERLLTSLRFLYMTSASHPKAIRLKVEMCDPVDAPAFKQAVEMTVKRYPYFCVRLKKDEQGYVYAPNDAPVIVAEGEAAELNSPASNDHLMAFSRSGNRIVLDLFHGLTDGTGAYEVMRTLLSYYCKERYQLSLPSAGIRLVGDEIPAGEWEDPVANTKLPAPARKEFSTALNLIEQGHLEADRKPTVYSVSIPEEAFMRFNIDHDGSPATMVSLFLCRAVHRLFPQSKDVIRISLCANQRAALHAPLAHQSLVGAALLEYKEQMQDWPVEKQATAFRGMVFAQTDEDVMLSGVASQKALGERFLSVTNEAERSALADGISQMMQRVQTATVSYVGRASCGAAERYVKDIRTWTIGEVPLLIEIASVNGHFTLDIIQHFESSLYVDAFLEELKEQGIACKLQDVQPLSLPNVVLPWS